MEGTSKRAGLVAELLFFRFPKKYQGLARDGIPIKFIKPGPTKMDAQPSLVLAAQKVLKDMIGKMFKRGYLAPPTGKISSLIKYFAVPKGPEDWRIVYDAGANGLNDCVWIPSFGLPTVSSLLRIVDDSSFMEDWDIGEMFHNFDLHHSTQQFAGVDVGPLDFSAEECPHHWLVWTQNLMGFKPSPFNSVRMFLIAEEVIRGDRHDAANPFQWEEIELNLPGTKGYTPTRAWISKRRVDGTLATDFVVFVDGKRLAGANQERVREGGHAMSTRESYLGIQDALRKWRAAGGSKTPGASAGVVVHTDAEGVMVLTSQDKWDKLKSICRHWKDVLDGGEVLLDHRRLLLDKGFLVYIAQAYPGMKPYLKGFHLSLEMWRGGRDKDGWKLPA